MKNPVHLWGTGFSDCRQTRMMISTPGTRFPRAVRKPPRRLAPVGSPLDALFPQESRTLCYKRLCFEILGKNPFVYKLKPCSFMGHRVFRLQTNSNDDFNSRHSLSAGGPEASSAPCACGVSPRHAFPAGVSHLPLQSTLF